MELMTPTVQPAERDMYARPYETGTEFIGREKQNNYNKLSAELSNLSATILQMQIKAEAERAEAEALSLSNKAFEELHKNQLEYAQLKNKDAIDAYSTYKDNIAKIIEKYTPTDEAQPLTKGLFNKKADDLKIRSNASLMSYQMEQIASWKMSELKSALDNTLNESLSNYGKPLFEDNKRKALDQYDYIADVQGIDKNSETYKLGRLQTTSGLHFNGIMNEINREQLGNAWKHLQQYKDELTAEDYNRLFINYQSSVARNSVPNGSNKLTDEDLIKYFEEYFDNNKHLHIHAKESKDGKITYTAITSQDNALLYDQVKRAFVNNSLTKHKDWVKARTTQDGYFKDSMIVYLSNNPPPASGRDLAMKAGITNPTEEQIDTAQLLLDRFRFGVGKVGNKSAFIDLRSMINDGSIYDEYATVEALKGYAIDMGLSLDQTDELVKIYEKSRSDKYRLEEQKASDLLNKKLTGAIGSKSIKKNDFAYKRALIQAQTLVDERIRANNMRATEAVNAVFSNPSLIADIKTVYEKSAEEQKVFNDTWDDTKKLSDKDKEKILNFRADFYQKNGRFPTPFEIENDLFYGYNLALQGINSWEK